MRALIDTGTSISLMNIDAFKQLKLGGALREADLVTCQADESKIKIDGVIYLPIEVGGVMTKQEIYVAPGICSEVILGEDWLKAQKAQLKFELATLMLAKVEIPLENKRIDTLPVVAQEEVKIPARTIIFEKYKILAEKELDGEAYLRQRMKLKKYRCTNW